MTEQNAQAAARRHGGPHIHAEINQPQGEKKRNKIEKNR